MIQTVLSEDHTYQKRNEKKKNPPKQETNYNRLLLLHYIKYL